MSTKGKVFLWIFIIAAILIFLFFPSITCNDNPNIKEDAAIAFLNKYLEISKIDDDRFIINNVELYIAGNRDFQPEKVKTFLLGYVKEKGLKHFFVFYPDKKGKFADDIVMFIARFRRNTIAENIEILNALKDSKHKGKIYIIQEDKQI